MASEMPSLDTNYSPTLQRKRALSSPRVSRSQPEIDPSKKKRHEFDYIRGLSNRERVDLVLSRLDGEHRWTIKDLIHYAVTEESEKKYGKSTKKRARDISTAIFDDKEVIDALSRASNDLRDHQILNMAKVFQTEFSELRAEPGLGKFNAEIEPQNLQGYGNFCKMSPNPRLRMTTRRREVSMVIYIYDLYDAGAFEGTPEEWLLP